jgi:hypothetical protein
MTTPDIHTEEPKILDPHSNPFKPCTFVKMEGEDEIVEWSPKHRFARVSLI